MIVAKVIGNIWATRKDDALSGLKLMIVQPLDMRTDARDGNPIIAADMIGAGVGEKVIVVSGSSARAASGGQHIPVDAAVVGIVDDQEISED